MEKAKLTLQVDATPDVINQILRRYVSFLNNSLQSMQLQIYFEPIESGVLIFYNRFEDFMQFHQLIQKLADLPQNPQIIPTILTQPTDIQSQQPIILVINLTFNHTDHPTNELFDLVIHSYQKITRDVQIERHSERSATFTYPNWNSFFELTKLIQAYLEQNNPI